jgi:hypothetical protein
VSTAARRVLAALTVFGLGALLFGPLQGGIAISGVAQAFVDRLTHGRFSAGEQAELAFLACLDEAMSGIPDGSDVHVDPISDPYLEQRLIEIAFPRIRPVDGPARFEIRIGEGAVPAGSLFAKTECGDVTVQVVDRG